MGYRLASIAQVTEIGNTQLSTVVVMIESPEAVTNIEAIVATPGVDVILVGTNDLSIELGHPGEFEHPDFVDSVERIARCVKRHDKILGVAGIYNRPDIMHKFIHQHRARFVLVQMDLALVAKATAAVATELQSIEDDESTT